MLPSLLQDEDNVDNAITLDMPEPFKDNADVVAAPDAFCTSDTENSLVHAFGSKTPINKLF